MRVDCNLSELEPNLQRKIENDARFFLRVVGRAAAGSLHKVSNVIMIGIVTMARSVCRVMISAINGASPPICLARI